MQVESLHLLKMEKFDQAYIGTGPISVVDACIADEAGKHVLMIDEKDQLGGAWVSINIGDFGLFLR